MVNQEFLTEKSDVPGDGLEPSRIIHPRDFKSLVSTNSTTRASKLQRRRPDSNRRITVLQTGPLATWVRRHFKFFKKTGW